MTAVQKPFSNIQLELLKIFPHNLSETDVKAIKKMLARYFMEKAIDEADRIAEERGYTPEIMMSWLNEENQ
ncbi:MAG: hypothetical protein ACK4YV_10710 [Emticicia sp.]